MLKFHVPGSFNSQELSKCNIPAYKRACVSVGRPQAWSFSGANSSLSSNRLRFLIGRDIFCSHTFFNDLLWTKRYTNIFKKYLCKLLILRMMLLYFRLPKFDVTFHWPGLCTQMSPDKLHRPAQCGPHCTSQATAGPCVSRGHRGPRKQSL